MTLSKAPMFFLEAQTTSSRRASRVRIHWIDYAFFTVALLVICGGALFLLELASLQSTGQGSLMTQFINETSVWLPALSQKLMTYGMLMVAGVVNSAVIVVFVQLLRNLDRMFSRSRQRLWPASRQISVRQRHTQLSVVPHQPVQNLNSSRFLLSPIIG